MAAPSALEVRYTLTPICALARFLALCQGRDFSSGALEVHLAVISMAFQVGTDLGPLFFIFRCFTCHDALGRLYQATTHHPNACKVMSAVRLTICITRRTQSWQARLRFWVEALTLQTKNARRRHFSRRKTHARTPTFLQKYDHVTSVMKYPDTSLLLLASQQSPPSQSQSGLLFISSQKPSPFHL